MVNRLMGKLGWDDSQKRKNQKLMKNLTGRYELFSFPFTDYTVEEHPLVQNADIVNLHWVSNFIHYPTFFKRVTKPIVWTFHDMNPFLGGFHYAGDLQRNKAIMGSLEEYLRLQKKQVMRSTHNITIVTPSKWLGEQLNLNDTFVKKDYTNIPYGLDLSVFKPHATAFARSVFNLPQDKKIILFVSENVNNYRKGFDLLVKATEQLQLTKDELIVTIGESALDVKDNLLSVGRISDDRLMSLLYAAADVFVLPSREDNFPNVMLESLACGTPVIAFTTGGMAEVIQHGFNGILAHEITASALGQAIEDFLRGPFRFDRAKIRDFAVNNFDLSIQATRYKELYKGLLTDRKSV